MEPERSTCCEPRFLVRFDIYVDFRVRYTDLMKAMQCTFTIFV